MRIAAILHLRRFAKTQTAVSFMRKSQRNDTVSFSKNVKEECITLFIRYFISVRRYDLIQIIRSELYNIRYQSLFCFTLKCALR